MNVTALVSEGGNHSPEQWAHVTTQAIIQIEPQIDAALHQQAHALIESVDNTLAAFYRVVIGKEAEALKMYFDRSDTPLAIAVGGLAESALTVIQELVEATPWRAKALNAEWALAALSTIASHFASAAHVERLVFADNNPTNAAAAAYKLRGN